MLPPRTSLGAGRTECVPRVLLSVLASDPPPGTTSTDLGIDLFICFFGNELVACALHQRNVLTNGTKMAENHIEPSIVTPEEALTSWPLKPVPRHLIPDEAHGHAVEFKKQSGASPDQIENLMRRHNGGLELDSFFEKKLEAIELDWQAAPAKGAGAT